MDEDFFLAEGRHRRQSAEVGEMRKRTSEEEIKIGRGRLMDKGKCRGGL